jgi:hypothetical protein
MFIIKGLEKRRCGSADSKGDTGEKGGVVNVSVAAEV